VEGVFSSYVEWEGQVGRASICIMVPLNLLSISDKIEGVASCFWPGVIIIITIIFYNV